MMTRVKTQAEIEAMRISGHMLASVLQVLKKKIRAGQSTKDLADIARAELEKLGGKPAFLGYQGFPDVICISVNDEVVHGIPRADHIIKEGDIVGLDFGVNYQGMITDGAISVIVGKPRSDVEKKLVTDTERAMMAGISEVQAGICVGDISAAVETSLKKAGNNKYGIVRDLVGHGVGHELHEAPSIPNYGRAGSGMELLAGMTIAIEPMVTLGREEIYIDDDQWTIKTQDSSRSAHFEHTILITKDGHEILTQM